MALSNQIIILTFISAFLTVVFGFVIESVDEFKGKAVNPRLSFLAKVGDKSFYTEPATFVKSWIDARKYCESQDMALAKLESQEEGNALKTGLGSTSAGYWVDGAEDTPIVFSDKSEFKTSLPIYWQPTLCLSFYPGITTSSPELRSDLCTKLSPVLCQR